MIVKSVAMQAYQNALKAQQTLQTGITGAMPRRTRPRPTASSTP
jgi:hypothetical protein